MMLGLLLNNAVLFLEGIQDHETLESNPSEQQIRAVADKLRGVL